MAKNLVIVESPSKAKTIQRFLGSGYSVIASGGHVRDLPKSQLGIDVEGGTFDPKYITIRGKGEQLALLRKEVKKAGKIYLATDPDREGEAISWHLSSVFPDDAKKKCYRVTFNEITKNAVKEAMKSPRKIDMDIVDAQQARRVLDRLVGYLISPLLWKKIKRGLSAGRVQSVVLRIIADREDEIAAFVPEEYWSLEADIKTAGSKKPVVARYYGENGKKEELKSGERVNIIKNFVEKNDFVVSDIKTGERVRKAPLPFTTSTLQQEASKALNFSTVKTMRVAQQLYEGVAVKGHGTIGLITYLRTDSTRISDEAHKACVEYVKENYGEAFAAKENNAGNGGKKIQDAHEAIRPTYIDITPASVKSELTNEQFRLYQLIWRRFVASRMAAAKYINSTITLKCGNYDFKTVSTKLDFEGFMSVYNEADDNESLDKKLFIPAPGEKMGRGEIRSEQHFTQPPAHFTEASMVKTMEELGIGRPSTYAPTISTLISRHYVSKEGKNLFITETGEAVNGIMKDYFSSIVKVDFTANMEMLLDGVEEGSVNWKEIVKNFYPDLNEAVKVAQEEIDKIKIADEVSDVQCDVCGRMMVIKYGPHGKFLGCPGFPECKNTKPFLEKTGVSCPKCGKELVIRRTRKGRRYYGCENYPECDFMSWSKPKEETTNS
ncbi:MAG: type I DNA topoisomerase [Lachnospiraceae bacterium]|nr:type I DNA topoisomerase [Lachnospiraceae bacterium]